METPPKVLTSDIETPPKDLTSDIETTTKDLTSNIETTPRTRIMMMSDDMDREPRKMMTSELETREIVTSDCWYAGQYHAPGTKIETYEDERCTWSKVCRSDGEVVDERSEDCDTVRTDEVSP